MFLNMIFVFVKRKELLRAFVVGYIKLVPIVKSRSFELFVVDFKAKGLDKVKCRTRGGAGTRDIARILRDLGAM